MESSDDKQWASKYLLDPLTAPAPSEETGPGTHYRSTFAPASEIAADDKRASTHVRETSYPSPPNSASPRQAKFPHSSDPFTESSLPLHHSSANRPSSEIPTSSAASVTGTVTGRQRGSSLTERYPGDRSHRPLDVIKQESKKANRAPHLRRAHIPGPDAIDRLDNINGVGYHHGGPFDATLLARNIDYQNSPIEAVSGSNEEALKATPRERVIDSIDRHRPLEGVADVPPGMPDRTGRVLNYEEGADLMIEDGYKRWPGVHYLPGDLKGKGEPSYTLEKALKDHKTSHRRYLSDGSNAGAIEMTTPVHRGSNNPFRRSVDSEFPQRPRSSGGVGPVYHIGGAGEASGAERHPDERLGYADQERDGDLRRRNTTGKKGNILSRRFGSLRKGKKVEGAA